MLRNFVFLILAVVVTVGLFSALFGGLVWQSKVKVTGKLPPQARAEIREQMEAELTPLQYKVLYEGYNEKPFSSPLLDEDREGTFVTRDTLLPVFQSADMYDSGTGWPSFHRVITENVVLKEEKSWFKSKTAVYSKDTGAYLGYVCDTDDEHQPNYCINGAALIFEPAGFSGQE